MKTKIEELDVEIKKLQDDLQKLYNEKRTIIAKKEEDEAYKILKDLAEKEAFIYISVYPSNGDSDKLCIGHIKNKYRPTFIGVIFEYSYDEDWGYVIYNVKKGDFYFSEKEKYDFRDKDEDLIYEAENYLKELNKYINNNKNN